MRETKHWYLPLDKHEAWLRQWILMTTKNGVPMYTANVKAGSTWDCNQRRKPRPRLGYPRSGGRRRGQSALRMVRRPYRLHQQYERVASRLVENGERSGDTSGSLHRKGQYRVPLHRILLCWKAEGSYILPDNVPSNEFLNLKATRFPLPQLGGVAARISGRLSRQTGCVALCAYSQRSETKDNDFTWKDFQARNNNELVAVYGNFVNRALQLTKKYFGRYSTRSRRINRL